MAQATEIAVLPLVSGAQIEDPSTPAGAVWKSTLDTIHAQTGVQRIYWGRQIENPSNLDLLIGKSFITSIHPSFPKIPANVPTRSDWDCVEAHKDFIASPEYGPFAKHLMTIIDGKISLNHANFTPHPPSAAVGRAPVTERLTLFFSADISEDDMKKFDENIQKFLGILKENAGDGFKAASSGWIVEEMEHEGIEGKARAITGVIGWESVEAHMAFREHPAFKENVGLVRGDKVKGSKVHHVKFQEK